MSNRSALHETSKQQECENHGHGHVVNDEDVTIRTNQHLFSKVLPQVTRLAGSVSEGDASEGVTVTSDDLED